MICEEVRVSIDDVPDVYEFASVTISPSWLTIYRLESGAVRSGQSTISSFGPHFLILFSQPLAWNAFERLRSEFHFRGPEVGSMHEISGAQARDGTYTHGISSIDIIMIVDPKSDRVSIDISGELCQTRKAIDGWPAPKPRNNFSINVEIPLSDAAELFHSVSDPQKHIDRCLQHHPDLRA